MIRKKQNSLLKTLMLNLAIIAIVVAAFVGVWLMTRTSANGNLVGDKIFADIDSATATVTYQGHNFKYEEIDATNHYVEIYKNAGVYGNDSAMSGAVEIPGTFTVDETTYTVTSIGSNAFRRCTSLTSITIPDGVTSIGNNAFFDCTGLTSITIPDGITRIGLEAFGNCKELTSITIPNRITRINEGTFSACTVLTSITIPDGVTMIGENAFIDCRSLTSIAIPDSVTDIGGTAFSGCTNLKYIKLSNAWNSVPSSYYGSIVKNCSSLYEIYTGGSVFGSSLPASYYVVNADGSVVDKNGATITTNAEINAENGYTSFDGLTNKHLIRADKVEDLFQLTVTSNVAMADATGYTLSSDKKTATKWSVAGGVYGELPEAEDENAEIVYKVNNEVVNVNSAVVANSEVVGADPNYVAPETGVAFNITLIATSIVLLGTVLVVARKKKDQY